jgi:hypothetical protein
MNTITKWMLGVTLIAGPMVSNAQFVTTSAWAAGDGLITEDTKSGLEWMNLVVTMGTSVNALLGGYGGLAADGFQIATAAQVGALFNDAGLAYSTGSSNTPLAANVVPAAQVISLLGCTLCALAGTSNYGVTEGLIQTPGEVGQVVVGVEAANGDIPDTVTPAALGYAGISTSINTLNYNAYSAAQDGIFLVREIPSTGKLLPGVDPNPAPTESYYSGIAPEIDPASFASGLTLLMGGLAVLRGRKQKNLAE